VVVATQVDCHLIGAIVSPGDPVVLTHVRAEQLRHSTVLSFQLFGPVQDRYGCEQEADDEPQTLEWTVKRSSVVGSYTLFAIHAARRNGRIQSYTLAHRPDL
jgi:hypothetical protein